MNYTGLSGLSGMSSLVGGGNRFTLSYLPTLTVVGGSVSDTTVLDRNIRTTTGAAVETEAIVAPLEIVFGTLAQNLVVTSSNTGIATVTMSGYEAIVNRVANGTVNIRYKTDYESNSIAVPLSLSGGATAVELLSYGTGSLAKHVSDSLDTLVGLSQDIEVFSGVNTRNAAVWTQVDMSSHQVWNSHTGGPQSVAISNLHTLCPHHYTAPVGATVRFIGNDNSVNERTIVSQQIVSGTDLRISKLSSVLPATVVPAKVLPTNYLDYLPSISTFANGRASFTIPGFYINKFNEAICVEVGIDSDLLWVYSPLDSFTNRHSLYTQPISGDSGSPVYIIINDQAVLLTTLWTASFSSSVPDNYTAINLAMSTLGGGQQLTEASMAGFTDYI